MNRPYLKYVGDYAKDAQIIAKNALLYHLTVMNNGAAAFWVQVFDLAAGTGTDGVPDFEIEVPNGNVMALPFHRDGYQMSNGIYVRAVTQSQGDHTKLIAANNAKFTAQYDGPWPLS